MPKFATKLKLATSEEMEQGQTSRTRQSRPQYHQQIQAKSQDQESRIPREHLSVGQILYAKDVYKDYPMWKRFVAIRLYLPIFRFLHNVVVLVLNTIYQICGLFIEKYNKF